MNKIYLVTFMMNPDWDSDEDTSVVIAESENEAKEYVDKNITKVQCIGIAHSELPKGKL